MISQVLGQNDQIRFMNTKINEKGKCGQVNATLAMNGHEVETFLTQFGAQFPISVETHKVVNTKDGAYMIVNGNKIPLDKEKADKMQEAQNRKGLLDSQKAKKGMSRD